MLLGRSRGRRLTSITYIYESYQRRRQQQQQQLMPRRNSACQSRESRDWRHSSSSSQSATARRNLIFYTDVACKKTKWRSCLVTDAYNIITSGERTNNKRLGCRRGTARHCVSFGNVVELIWGHVIVDNDSLWRWWRTVPFWTLLEVEMSQIWKSKLMDVRCPENVSSET